MTRRFIGEQLRPLLDRAESRQLEPGAPVMPGAFEWRGQEYPVLETLHSWKELSPCKQGAAERYLRTHWYRIKTVGDLEWTLYFLRQAQSGRRVDARWYLYTLDDGTPGEGAIGEDTRGEDTRGEEQAGTIATRPNR